MSDFISLPLFYCGPVSINFAGENFDAAIPLATFERPIWHSVNRGAKVANLAGGLNVVLLKNNMTRSIILEADSILVAASWQREIDLLKDEIKEVAENTSHHLKFLDYQIKQVANLLYVRFSFFTAEASGHNMATKAADAIGIFLKEKIQNLKYLSVSGNFCVDKKVSAINSLEGRGKELLAEVVIPDSLCQKYLRTLPQKIVDLNTKKNLLGSIVSGSLCSANAHFANILLAFYLALGQDGANVVEGSQGITYASLKENGDLYFSVTIPNIIIGSLGNKVTQNFLPEILNKMNVPNLNAEKLAAIASCAVLCGELSLLAALSCQGQLTRSHMILER